MAVNNNAQISYIRGSDLSGSLEGAGGIGGLLTRSSGYSGGSWTSHAYYHADGNGNITAMLDGNANLVAFYRYDPFGNLTAKTGTLPDANVYRFSSKEIHLTSGMYYFGFRFYDPNLQKWINRDPIHESGGVNLYDFVGNNANGSIDPLGLYNPIMGFGLAAGPASRLADASFFMPPPLPVMDLSGP